MKQILAIAFFLSLFQVVQAQAPLGFNYQGIAREADGTPIANKEIAIRISIINGPQGSVEFEEEHFLTTNDFGLFTAVVGQGNGNSTLNSVNWAGGNLWLQIELDPDNTGDFLLMGSQQLMSVPYALFAEQSGAGLNPGYGVDINNGTISNVLPDRPITLTGKGNTNITGTYPNFTIESTGSVDGDADATNELQTIAKTGSTVTLSNNGGSFTDAVDDADADATNEIQDLQLVGNNLTITNNGSATTIDLSAYLDNTDTQLTETEVDAFANNNGYLTSEVDGNATNELQTISKSGNTVTLSNSGGSFTDAVNDADNDATNEIQDLQLVGNNLTITKNGSATTIDLSAYLDNTDTQLTEAEVDAFANNNGYLTAEVDGSATNELQTISKTGSTVTLSNSGGSFTDAVDDADNNATNEIQDLQLTGNNLTITNNGSATTIDLSPYLDNTDTQLTEAEVDAFANNNGYLTSEIDGSVSNEIQDLSSTVSGINRTINISGGSGTTISVADNDNSASNEIQNLSSVLAQGADANNTIISNIANPVNNQDAVNLQYLETKVATNYAINIPISYSNVTGMWQTIVLSGATIDKGGLVSGGIITITETGVYSVSVQGSSNFATGSDIGILINGDIPNNTNVLKNFNYYNGTYLFDLSASDTISLLFKALSGNLGESLDIQLIVFKI